MRTPSLVLALLVALTTPLTASEAYYRGGGFNAFSGASFNVEATIYTDGDKGRGNLDVDGVQGGLIICGAGNFTGTIKGDDIEAAFLSMDNDPGCGFEHGQLIQIEGAFSNDRTILEGDFAVSNGQSGEFTITNVGWQFHPSMGWIFHIEKGWHYADDVKKWFYIDQRDEWAWSEEDDWLWVGDDGAIYSFERSRWIELGDL